MNINQSPAIIRTAAAYIRVSTDEQTEYSPESQIKMIRSYAEKNNYTLPEKFIFIDEGISGKTAGKRPAFLKMIGIAKTTPKPFDAILLWKFSRFARSREDSIVYKSMLRKQLGIDVISISENLGDDKMSILFEAMIEAMDEYYSINLAEEVKRGMTEKAKRGEPLSSPPFGYKIINKQLTAINEEKEIIKQVFSQYANGISMLKIAKDLNELGIRTHRGNKIENRTIEYWLNNPIYIGKIRWNPNGITDRNYSCKNIITAQGNHERFIDDTLWENVQKKLREQKKSYKKYYKPKDKISHWLTGLIRCGICGGSVVNCSGYFCCNNHLKGTCPGNGGIKAEIIESYVIRQLENIAYSRFKAHIPENIQSTDNYINLLKTQLKRNQQRLIRVKSAYENGIDSLEEYSENKIKIQNETDIINAKIKEHNILSLSEPKNHNMPINFSRAVDIFKEQDTNNKIKNIAAHAFINIIIKTGSDGNQINIIFRRS